MVKEGSRNAGPGKDDAPDVDTNSAFNVDPDNFLRALLHISPEDAETVRERTPGTRPEKPRQGGPTADYGNKD